MIDGGFVMTFSFADRRDTVLNVKRRIGGADEKSLDSS
jgi:hypothetical protein